MENKQIPGIRFPGFIEKWDQRTIGEFGYFYYGRSAPKWSVTSDATTPCVRYGELYTKYKEKIEKVFSFTNIPKEKLKFSTGNEVLIPRVGEAPLDFANCSWLSIPGVAIGEMISVYNTKQNPLFTAYMFNALYKHEFAKRVEGGNVSNLYYTYLEDISVSYPTIEEQDKIASFFDNLDSLITLHQQKLDTLKQTKQGFLQKMFPKEGESVPEIRFPGFTEGWKNRKLEEFGEATGGTAIESDFSTNGKYKVISIGSYSESSTYTDQGIRAIETEKTKKRVLNKGDLTMILNDKTSSGRIIGRVLLIDEDDVYVYNQRTERIEPDKNKYDSQFLYQLLNADSIRSKIIQMAQGNTQIYVNWTGIANLEYLVPSIDEQIKIGTFFKQLDNAIGLHKQELETLKQTKKAFSQKMFV